MTKKQSLCVFRELHLTWGTTVRYLIQCSISCDSFISNKGLKRWLGSTKKTKKPGHVATD